MGFSVCHTLVSQPACTAGQAAGLNVGCEGWQTAPGGGGFKRFPAREELSWAHFSLLGHEAVPGMALQSGRGLGFVKGRSWRRYVSMIVLQKFVLR